MANKTYVHSLEATLDSEIASLEASKQAATRAGASAQPAPPAPGAPAPAASAPWIAPPPAPLMAPPMPAATAPLREARQSRRGRVVVAIAAVVGLLLLLGILLSSQVARTFSETHIGSLPTATVLPLTPRPTVPPGATATATRGTPGASATATPVFAPSPTYPNPAAGLSLLYCIGGLLLLFLFLALLFLLSRRWREPAHIEAKRGASPLPETPGDLEALDLRITRLAQIREWLKQDARLRDMVDDAIRNQVLASERRQRTLSVILSVASLGVGWLLSPINPLAIMAGFLHR